MTKKAVSWRRFSQRWAFGVRVLYNSATMWKWGFADADDAQFGSDYEMSKRMLRCALMNGFDEKVTQTCEDHPKESILNNTSLGQAVFKKKSNGAHSKVQ